jgi:hypothetical protein
LEEFRDDRLVHYHHGAQSVVEEFGRELVASLRF